MGMIAKLIGWLCIGFLGLIGIVASIDRQPSNSQSRAPAFAPAQAQTPTVIPESMRLADHLEMKVQGKASRMSSVAVLTLTVRNTSDIWLKDAVILCEFFGRSGTKVGQASRTAYREFPPKKAVTVREINFGFVDQEADRVGCHATSAERASPV
jgi:hypothetical protein